MPAAAPIPLSSLGLLRSYDILKCYRYCTSSQQQQKPHAFAVHLKELNPARGGQPGWFHTMPELCNHLSDVSVVIFSPLKSLNNLFTGLTWHKQSEPWGKTILNKQDVLQWHTGV